MKYANRVKAEKKHENFKMNYRDSYIRNKVCHDYRFHMPIFVTLC